MKKIECPKDIGFENTFPDKECEMRKFYGDCFHCWNSSIVKYKRANRNEAIQEFADKMIVMMPGHKQDILKIAEEMQKYPD